MLIQHAKKHPHKLNRLQKITMGIINFLAKHELHLLLKEVLEQESLHGFMLKKQLTHLPFVTQKLQSQLGLNLEETDNTVINNWAKRVEKLIRLSFQYGVSFDFSMLCNMPSENNKWQFQKKNSEQSTYGLVQSFEADLNKISIKDFLNNFANELNGNISQAKIRAYLICLINNLESSDQNHLKLFLINSSDQLTQKIFYRAPNDLAGILFYLLLIKLSFNFMQDKSNNNFILELISQTEQYTQSNKKLLPFFLTATKLISSFDELVLDKEFNDAQSFDVLAVSA